MRIVLQRVKHACVRVNDEEVARVAQGILALVGFGAMDGPDLPEKKVWRTLLKKIIELRIFPDAAGKTNLSCGDYAARVEPANTGMHGTNCGGILLVSQFTLYADCQRGRRPSFHPAAPPDVAAELFASFAAELDAMYPGYVGTGIFGAEMDIELCNWGPVTILLDSTQFDNGCG